MNGHGQSPAQPFIDTRLQLDRRGGGNRMGQYLKYEKDKLIDLSSDKI
jgi:hypothetical protein